MDYPATIHSCGYSVTREKAMANFKEQWQSSALSLAKGQTHESFVFTNGPSDQ